MSHEVAVITAPVYFLQAWYCREGDTSGIYTDYISDVDTSFRFAICATDIARFSARLVGYRFLTEEPDVKLPGNNIVFEESLYASDSEIAYMSRPASFDYARVWLLSARCAARALAPSKYRQVQIVLSEAEKNLYAEQVVCNGG